MKKLIIFLLVLISVTSLFAVNFNTHFGLISGFGVSDEKSNWIYGLDMETTFPTYGLSLAIVSQCFKDGSFFQSFVNGSIYFVGTDLYAFRSFSSNEKLSWSVGASILFGTETALKNFECVAKAGFRLDYKLNELNKLYAVVDFPLLDVSYIKGMNSPFIRVPEYKAGSVCNGWRIGYSHSIVK